jgi:HSP20 family molecular chaperone IbpA
MKIANVFRGKKLSTKWRRSKKHLKWSSIKNSDKKKTRSKFSHPEALSASKKESSPNYRSSQYYGKKKWRSPTPLIDIFQEKNWITIIVEIAGFNKETFKIDVKDQKLTLSAKGNDRRYYKSLNLPKVVIPNTMSTKYNNGVLQIKLRKAKKAKS